jgi:hypothetical protein
MERIYSSYSFTTSPLDGVGGQRHAPAALYPGKGPTVPIVQEAGWETLLLLQENKTYHVIYEVIMAASLKMRALLEYSSVWFCKS